ncbi:hypothetical protein GCM10008018_44140 [Paenibacillus marchantiophytorum]|uniref:Uncharacterized protein n=1 Tax=Paenibacillus marchantiophytorum TaxID=1619310 RepID=A0ABQ1EYA6_9BACL|nr:hypothetical protein GCM10008018_44140 [Paenibacillus marchantiophytorum]
MKNVLTILAANFDSEEQLKEFVEIIYNEDGDARPSGIMTSIGTTRLDYDFVETHFFNDVESRQSFWDYLCYEYCSNESFSKQIPPTLNECINQFNSIILLYGNDSLYGSVNKFLFQIGGLVNPIGSSAVFLSCITY